jgi:uncharacterized protein
LLGTYTLPAEGTPFDLSGITTGSSNASIDGGSVMQGWYAVETSGSGTTSLYGSDAGSFNTGGLYSYGAPGSTTRSLGAVASPTSGNVEFGVLLYNNTSTSYTQFSLAYVAQLWRNNTTAKGLSFGYAISNTDSAIPTSGLTTVNSVSLASGSFAALGSGSTSIEQTAPSATQNISGTHIALSSACAQRLHVAHLHHD